MTSKQIAAGALAALVLAGAGYFEYSRYREAGFNKSLFKDMASHQRIAAEKAKAMESYKELPAYYSWFVDDTRQLIQAHRADATPKGTAMLDVFSSTLDLMAAFNEDLIADLMTVGEATESPGRFAQRPDYDDALARLQAAIAKLEHAPDRVMEERNKVGQLVSQSSADQDTRVILWQTFGPPFEPMIKEAERVPKRLASMPQFITVLNYLHAKRDKYRMSEDGQIVFADGWALADYRQVLLDASLHAK